MGRGRIQGTAADTAFGRPSEDDALSLHRSKDRAIPRILVITAALFGYAHRHGYPPGLFGAFLAGLYGLAMGWLRAFTGGIGLPIIAHIVADATIFTLMMRSGSFSE